MCVGSKPQTVGVTVNTIGIIEIAIAFLSLGIPAIGLVFAVVEGIAGDR